MNTMDIIRAGVPVATVAIDEKTVLQTKLMNEDVILSEFVSDAVLPIAIGDYVTFRGRNYYMNSIASIVKKNNNTFKYTATFQSELYDLNQKLLISSDGLTDFSYAADPLAALQLVVSNMNVNFSGWTVGTVDTADVQVIPFYNETCRQALGKIAEVFGFEFEVIGKTINFIRAIGTAKPDVFQYGRNNGLYEIERRQVENKSIFTRVYGYGGTKNIPFTYRDRAKRLVFEERYLEKNVNIYGLKEGQFTDEEIYPKRTAPLTGVNMQFTETGAFNLTDSYVEDTTLNFDINDYLLEGMVAKIVFKSGALSGYEFEIWKYDYATKRIYFNPFNETDGYMLPSGTSKPAVGDKYTLVDIKMPGIYVIEAEQALKAATQRYIDENCVPKIIYIVKIDPKYAKANNVDISAGDLVKVVDVQLGISRSIRISQISFPICNPYKMTAVIADFIPFSLQQLAQKNQSRQAAQLRTVVNNINTTVNNNDYSNRSSQVINNYGAEYPEPDVVIINGREFNFTKAVYNVFNLRVLEAGDIISDQFWDEDTYVTEWRYMGGPLNDRDSYYEIESIDTSSPIMLNALNKLKVKLLTEETEPQYFATVDKDGVFGKTPFARESAASEVDKYLKADVSGAYEIDLSKATDFHLTMTADTVFTFKNDPVNEEVMRPNLKIDGPFVPTFPEFLEVVGIYEPLEMNNALLELWHDGGAKGVLTWQKMSMQNYVGKPDPENAAEANQLAIWTDADKIKGDPKISYNPTTKTLKLDGAQGNFETILTGEYIGIKNKLISGGWSRPLLDFRNANDEIYFLISAYGNGQSFRYSYWGKNYDDTTIKVGEGKVDIGTPGNQNPQFPLNVHSGALRLLETGHLILGKYGAGTFLWKPKYALGVSPTGGVIEFEVGDKYLKSDVSGAYEIDLSKATDFHLTMTANTVFTFKGFPVDQEVKRPKLKLKGAFVPTFPAFLKVFGDDYDGLMMNDALLELWTDDGQQGMLVWQNRETL